MKLTTQIASATVIVAAGLISETAEAREAVIVMSPVGTVEEKAADIKAIALHLIDTVEPGEEAWVIDGLSQKQIAHYALKGDVERYQNKRNRMRDNSAFFKDMKGFADAAIEPKEDVFAGQISLSTTLRTINASYPAGNSRDLIFYAASPVTHDPRHLIWSMRDGFIPDDDHHLSSWANTPYGAAGEGSYVQNYTVHWGMNGTDWSVSDRHEHFMMRYISQAFTFRGADLASFAPDPETALRNARTGISERLEIFEPRLDGRRTMVHFRPTAALDEGDKGGSIYERTLSQRQPDINELRAAQNVEIAIKWECACDFDLAVQVWGDNPISFRAPRGVSGTLFKDFTSSASLKAAWETVAIPGPVDLRALTVAINQFSGPSNGANAELRIAINGETWGRNLSFSGPADGGAGFERTLSRRAAANPAWVIVNPVSVMEAK